MGTFRFHFKEKEHAEKDQREPVVFLTRRVPEKAGHVARWHSPHRSFPTFSLSDCNVVRLFQFHAPATNYVLKVLVL